MDSEFWQDAEHRIERARDLLRRRRLPEALEELRAAAELDPANAVHHFELGSCLDLMGRPEEAADAYARASDLDPTEPAYLNALGVSLLKLARWREAVDVFAGVERLDPGFEPAYINRILAYAELGDHDRAEQMFYLAQQVRDDNPQAFYNVARSLAARHLWAKATWCWLRVMAILQNPAATLPAGESSTALEMQCYLRLAEAMVRQDKPDDARRYYLLALVRDPRHVDALLGLGELLLAERQYHAAGERITKAVRLDPDDPRGHLLAGRRFLAIGKLDEAAVALRRAAELDPTLPNVHLLMARAAARVGDGEGVKRHCRLEMVLRPDDAATLGALADLLMNVSDFDNAAACLKRLVAVCPSDTSAWQDLGVAECRRGHLMQGVVASRRALKLDPRNVRAANNLALAFLEMRELDAAAKVLRELPAAESVGDYKALRRLKVRLRLLQANRKARHLFRRVLRLQRDED